MTRFKLLLFLLCQTFFMACSGQDSAKKPLVVPDFNWTIEIPGMLIPENMDEWRKVQERGNKAVEDAANTKFQNKVNTLFIYKAKDQSFCFFEATSEKNDNEKFPDYVATCERMNDIFYNTLTTQVPGAKVDTLKTVEIIDNIKFQTLAAKIVLPNGTIKNAVIFRSLFNDTELTVSIMFSDQQAGDKMIDAFRRSKFN